MGAAKSTATQAKEPPNYSAPALEKGLVKLALTKPFHVAQLEMAIREATRKPRTQEAPPSKKGAVA